jgi:nucleotide-binding universal stress UspA family protein
MKALVAVDGSEASRRAMDIAAELAKGGSLEVSLIHVLPQSYVAGSLGVVTSITYEQEGEAKGLLTSAKEYLASKGVEVKATYLPQGDPADQILQTAEKEGFELIVMGSRGLSPFDRLLLGSVSRKVVDHAHCSVLIARR